MSEFDERYPQNNNNDTPDQETSEPVLAESTDTIDAEFHPEETHNTIRIDLSGGAVPQVDTTHSQFYTENIKDNKKKNKGSKRFVAAMVSLTILNLALFGGAFMLGKNYGAGHRSVASKQELITNLRGDEGTPMSETANNGIELATTEIAKKVGPSVVGITSTVQSQLSFFGGISQSASQGSGIILSSDGYIVTNNHVVDSASAVMVTLNTGTEYEATVVGKDAQTDLAIIKIEPKEDLIVATLGDSNALEVGERVVAIGNPMGLEFFGSVTQGIVSAVNRTIDIDNRTMNLIQTDAAINSGNSGGALINTRGEVVGINSVKVAYAGVEGMSFAIPISEASPIISDLLEYGYVKGRPVIGISTRDVSAYMSQSYSWPQGAQVMDVSSETARNAGLQQGDIITAVNGEKITSGEELNKIKDKHKPGEQLSLDVYKYATGKNETVKVTLSEQLPG